jgi:hypothetical protein
MPAANRVVVDAPSEEATREANAPGAPAILPGAPGLAPDCSPTPSPTATRRPTATPSPTATVTATATATRPPTAVTLRALHAGFDLGAWLRNLAQPATPAATLRYLGGPYLDQDGNTAFLYLLSGPVGTELHLWTLVAAVVDVPGPEITWARQDDHLAIRAAGDPAATLRMFSVVLAGTQSGNAIRWAIVGQGGDTVFGAGPAPRGLPSAGRLYLPLVRCD